MPSTALHQNSLHGCGLPLSHTHIFAGGAATTAVPCWLDYTGARTAIPIECIVIIALDYEPSAVATHLLASPVAEQIEAGVAEQALAHIDTGVAALGAGEAHVHRLVEVVARWAHVEVAVPAHQHRVWVSA